MGVTVPARNLCHPQCICGVLVEASLQLSVAPTLQGGHDEGLRNLWLHVCCIFSISSYGCAGRRLAAQSLCRDHLQEMSFVH